MMFEATYIDGKIYMFEANNLASAYKLAGKNKPIAVLKLLTESEGNIVWNEIYTRRYTEVVAYVNAYLGDIPVASVPIKAVVEGYQKLREVKVIAEEIDRINNIWPNAIIKIQKTFAKY